MKWEYKTAVMEDWIMSELGADEWELVSVVFDPKGIERKKLDTDQGIINTYKDGAPIGYFKRQRMNTNG